MYHVKVTQFSSFK